MEARQLYRPNVTPIRSRPIPLVVQAREEDPRIGSGCPVDNFDPNNIASESLLQLAQQAGLDPSRFPPGATYGPPSRALREFMSKLVREARRPQVKRDGVRNQLLSLTTVTEATGPNGLPTYDGVKFVFPPGAEARIGCTLNDDTRVKRLVISHPAADDGLMVSDSFMSGRNQQFVSGWIVADAFAFDTQCPMLQDTDLGTPGTKFEIRVLNSNAAGPGNTLSFTAFVEASILIGGEGR